MAGVLGQSLRMRGLPDLKTKAKVDVYGMGIPVRIDLSFFYFIGVKMKSFLTKGILNDMAIIINKNYELPLNLEIDFSPKEIVYIVLFCYIK